MKRTYAIVVEGNAEDGYSAYVPELPAILVTGATQETLTSRAAEAIQLYWEASAAERSPDAVVREIEVEIPALV